MVLFRLPLHAAPASVPGPEEDSVVALDDARPTPTFTLTDTAVPSPTPSFTASPLPTPPVTATPMVELKHTDEGVSVSAKSLQDPDFDHKAAASDNEDDGLVIIAPGASSPEESLESFGIDTPFNWKEVKRKKIAGLEGETGTEGGETIELNAPETSDLKEKVSVEPQGSVSGSGSDNYDLVERAGFVLPESDLRFDATILREKMNRVVFSAGSQIYLEVEASKLVYPGSIYTIYRIKDKVKAGDEAQTELGTLIRGVGIARVIRVDSENILARIEKQYDFIRTGDRLRLRDPDRARHFASLRQSAGDTPPSDLRGHIAEIQDSHTTASEGQFVYLDLGRAKGATPGMKLIVTRDPHEDPDPLKNQPGAVGKLGELSVVSVQKDSCTARVNRAITALQVGDQVRYR